MRPLVCLGFVAVLALSPLASSAAPTLPVAIGEVTSEVTRQNVDLGAVLRTVLEQELPAVDMGGHARHARPTLLSASLVRMERASAASGKAWVTVVVSATLRDKKRGAVIAVLEGRARAENEEKLVELLERAALKSAVRGALSRIPEALDASR